MRIPLIALAALLGAGAAHAALPETGLDRAYRQMYNLDFDAAQRTLAEWQRVHPEDAMGPASEAAALLYSEFDRLHILESEYFVRDSSFLHMDKATPDPVLKTKFEAAIGRADQLAERALSRSPQDEDALLASIICPGLHADYLALIEKRYLAALNEIKASRAAADRTLAAHPTLYDAYLAIGEENYLLSQKAAPVRWLLHLGGAETDKRTGIEKLRITAEKGRYFAPYAKLMLAIADLRDNHVDRARQQLAWLVAEFPQNRLYRQELAKLRS